MYGRVVPTSRFTNLPKPPAALGYGASRMPRYLPDKTLQRLGRELKGARSCKLMCTRKTPVSPDIGDAAVRG